MRDMPDYRDWYVPDNLEIELTCFHLGATDFGCMSDISNALTLLQQFMTRGIFPIISSKWWMYLSTPSCPPSYPLHEFWSAGATGTMPPPSMN